MINKDKIVFNTKTYYICSWCGVIGVKVLKHLKNDYLLVQAGNDLLVRPIQFVYNKYEHARRGSRDWEHFERNRKKQKKKSSIKTKKCNKK